ncbi:MAG: ribonuclease E/G, partial [Proteobacteria bacterium]|nr:ribonuclease E/G [Pseudomonadota bacterium]
LTQLWKAVDGAAGSQKAPFLIYQDASLVIRAIRDYFRQDIGEILIDTESIYEQARQFMGHVMPHNVDRVKWYQEETPLFSRFQIEHQTESAYSRQVLLPSGGSIVIDHTEAMVSIDVNSARSTRGSDIEETARKTNIEAAEEIARQLRLRDLGGLVVIDFIDMENPKSQREVENTLREALRYDRARVNVGKISRFGLLELARQRLQTSLGETSHITCPRCSGTGTIRSVESTALHVLRIVQEEAMKESTAAVHAQVPVAVASYLLNEKRHELYAIEQRVKVSCVLIPNTHLETPHYTVKRVRHDELNQIDTTMPSYNLVEEVTEQGLENDKKQDVIKPSAAVKGVTPIKAPPSQIKKDSFFKRLILSIFGSSEDKEKSSSDTQRRNPRTDRRHGSRDDERNDRRRGRIDSRGDRRRPRRGRGRYAENGNDDSSNNSVQQKEKEKKRVDTSNNRSIDTTAQISEHSERREDQAGSPRRTKVLVRLRNRRNDGGENTASASVATMGAESGTQGQQAPSPQSMVSTGYDVDYEALGRETPHVAETRHTTVDKPEVKTNGSLFHSPSDEDDVREVVHVPAAVAETLPPIIRMPIMEEPILLPQGMTMIETTPSASGSSLESQQNTAELEKAREERRMRRQAKDATISASEPLQRVETKV